MGACPLPPEFFRDLDAFWIFELGAASLPVVFVLGLSSVPMPLEETHLSEYNTLDHYSGLWAMMPVSTVRPVA